MVEELARLEKEYGRTFSLQITLKANIFLGPVVRISPRSILVSDPEVIRRVLAVGSRYTRGPWFDSLRLDPRVTNVVSERESKKHQQLRNILGVDVSRMHSLCSQAVLIFSVIRKRQH